MIWSGRIYSDGYQSLNASGYSWSTTVLSYQLSYVLFMNTSGYMDPQTNNYKLVGYPVRCLAQLFRSLLSAVNLSRYFTR